MASSVKLLKGYQHGGQMNRIARAQGKRDGREWHAVGKATAAKRWGGNGRPNPSSYRGLLGVLQEEVVKVALALQRLLKSRFAVVRELHERLPVLVDGLEQR
jgi:hypothetical protein